MDQSLFKEHLENKLNLWGRELSILQDDIDRSDEDAKEEYQLLMQDLMRAYENIESRLDEVEEMTDAVFADEKTVMEEMMTEFETQLSETREKVKDI